MCKFIPVFVYSSFSESLEKDRGSKKSPDVYKYDSEIRITESFALSWSAVLDKHEEESLSKSVYTWTNNNNNNNNNNNLYI
jgi:hypothetical protein